MVGIGYCCIHFLWILVFQIFKKLHGHFLGKNLSDWQCNVIIRRLIQHCSCLLIRFIVRPLSLGKKGVLWKHHYQPVSQLIKTTFSQKQLIEFLWNFIQIFGFFRTKKWYSQEKNLIFGKKPEISLKGRLLELVKKIFHWCDLLWFTWCTILVFMILQKPHVSRKSLSQVIYENALNQSDSKRFNITGTIWGLKFLFWKQLSTHGSYSLIM